MKKKTFILTLMMVFCTIAFGQTYHWEHPTGWQLNSTLTSIIKINGVEYNADDRYELGAFSMVDGKIRGRERFTVEDQRYYMLIVGNSGEKISFKLYDHENNTEVDMECLTSITYYDMMDFGLVEEPIIIEFQESVAQIGTTKYQTLEAAVEAVGIGETITVLKDINLSETLIIAAEKNFTLDLNGNDITANLNICGNLIVTGEGDFNANVVLAKETATLTAIAGLNVTTTIDAYSVVYENGMYKLKEIVYVAQIGETKYETLAEAIAAAQTGETIVLLADITLANAIDITGKTIDLNGKNLKGNVIGTIRTNGGLYTTAENYRMIGVNADYYKTADATVVIAANTDITIKAGTVELAQSWNTLENQILTVAQNATFVVPANMTFELNATAIVEGTLTVNGQIILANKNATLTAVAGLNVITNIADQKVVYEGGMYKVVAKVYVAQVGTTKYETLAEAYNAATAENGIVLLSNVTLQTTWKIEKAINIALGSYTVSGTIELADTGATVTGTQNAVTSVVTNIADHKVVYEGGMYQVVAKVYVAQVGDNKYETLQAAIAAAQTGQTIVLLANVESTNVITLENVTLDLNGKTVKADIIGTVKTNGGLWITSTEHKMLGKGADIYSTENATVVNSANEVNIVSGAITLAATEWWTLQGQNLTINSGATFTIPATSKFNVMNGTTVTVNGTAINNGTLAIYGTAIVNGTFTATGTVELADVNATLKAQAGLNVITNIADHKVVYADDMYQVVAKVYVAQIGSTKYETLEDAIAAATSGQTIELLWAEGNAPIAMNASLFGKNVTITGTATVDWSKGFLFVGRGGEGNATLTFDNANLTSASDNASTGIHVSGREKNTNNKYDGTVIIKNSTIELDYLINKGAMTLDNSTFTVKNGFSVGGRPASETENGVDATATIALTNASKLVVNNHNGMGLGYEAIGIMDIDQTSSFKTTQSFLVTAKGTMNIAGTAEIAGTLTNNGTITLTDKDATLTANEGVNVITNIADYKVVYENGMYQVVAKVYVAQVGSTKYESLEEAIAAVPANQTITVLKDITLAETLTIAAEKNFTLDLNGKAINVAYQEYSTGKHIYAFDNKGSLTLANGTINARGIFNYGTLTVNATATINSIDANGGYGVDNYGTLNVYGTIATTNEDNDAPESGNYDATPINNRTNATVNVFEGSVIANVSNYTYALDNKGTAIIKGGSFSSGHTTVGNSGTMTIEGGSFVCNGSDGISSHALIAEAGTVTIKGGTFNGKDNNNGFNVYASEGAKVYISGGNFLSCYSGSLYGAGTIEVSGGKFFDAVPENRCAAGYIPTQFTDGTYGVKPGSYIAQIGTTKYETFDEAYTAAKTDDVVVLFRTVVITNSKPWINYSKKNITVKAEFGETAFRVQDGAYVWFGGMTIESNDYCIIVGASDSSSGATVELYGGTYYGATSAVSVTKGDVKIMGGTFKVEPYQGSYEYTINCIDANYNNKTAKVAIQGGKFYNFNPMNNAAEGANTNFVVANHITVKDTDNYWTVVALPTTDKIVSSEDHTVTSNGYGPATVTVTGEVPCVANGQGIVSNWIGFRITKPEGVDANVARVFTPGSNGTYNEKTLASILDEGKDYASMWASIQYKREFDYKIDWNNDGIMDLVINIDATAATIKHNYVEVERVEPSYGQDGYILYRCGCGHEYKEILPAENVAQIGETKYTTLEAAAAAAKANETIVVLADVKTTNVALPTDVTLDLNGKTVEADIIGKISINKGLWVTKEGYKMIGDGAEYYQTTDATIVMGANYSIEMISGTVNLAKELWYTLQGQNITIKQGATFNISAGQTFVINGSTVENNGTVNNAGTIQILESATVKGNITGNLHFKGGNYITADNHNMVGTTDKYHYNATDALVNIASNGDITIAAGAMTLGHDWRTLPGQTVTVAEGAAFTVPTGMTYQIYGTAIVNGTITVNGTVELADINAMLTAPAGLNVVTNVPDRAVAYENGTYKVVQAICEQVQTIPSGWSWFSSYVKADDILSQMKDQIGAKGSLIKNQSGEYVQYDATTDWYGTNGEFEVSVTKMYMVKNNEASPVSIKGNIVDPTKEENAIEITKNWNWIGYPMTEKLAVSDALSGIAAPSHNDLIKAKDGCVAFYIGGFGWVGSLNSMEPGQGYMYCSHNERAFTFNYSYPSRKETVQANITSENNYWVPNVSKYQGNMTMIAVLNVDGNEMKEDFEVAAMVDGEVRGSARPMYVEALGRYVLFLSISGEDGEEVAFKCYDIYSDEEYTLSNRIVYSDNAIFGTASELYVLSLNTMGIGENASGTFSIYPNPTSTGNTISLDSRCDMVEVFNSLGVKVAEYRNVDTIDGLDTAGVYVIRVTNGSAVSNCRVIVK